MLATVFLRETERERTVPDNVEQMIEAAQVQERLSSSCDEFVAGLRRVGIEKVHIGRWVHRGGNDFDKIPAGTH